MLVEKEKVMRRFEDKFWDIFPYVFIPLWCVIFFGIIAFNIFALFNPRVIGEYHAQLLAPIIEKIKEK
jgi:hypothetical protein